jgi:hypothetical protein
MKPAGGGAGKFTPHHAAADYSKAKSFHLVQPIQQRNDICDTSL